MTGSKKVMLIVVVITVVIVGVFLFFATFFTIYTEHKDFYVTFHCTKQTGEPAQQVAIKHIDFISDNKIFHTDSTGNTKPILIRSEAVKNLFTRNRPSIRYFNPLFQFPDVDSNFYRIKLFADKKSHEIIMYTQQKDVIMERGKVVQTIRATSNEKVSTTTGLKIIVQHIFIEEEEVKIHLSIKQN
ncbi:MAG: hypothetical protein ACK5WV_13990 [Chryseotalea sp.]|jgi:hypothetical protein